jgi:hypothetical protein
MADPSTSFKQAAYAQETDNVFIALLTFTSDELSQPIYVCTDPYELLPIAQVRGVVSNGIEFPYLPFDITLPRDDRTGTVSSRLRIENVSRQIIGSARSIRKPVSIKIQTVLSRDVDTVEAEFNYFKLNNVVYDGFMIQGDLTLDYWGLEPWPFGRFTPAGFRGMF